MYTGGIKIEVKIEEVEVEIQNTRSFSLDNGHQCFRRALPIQSEKMCERKEKVRWREKRA